MDMETTAHANAKIMEIAIANSYIGPAAYKTTYASMN